MPDVAYVEHDTPIGRLVLAATEAGLVRLALPNRGRERTLAEIAERVSPRLLEHPARLDRARREIDEYFSGRRRTFELPLDMRLGAGFRRRVLDETALIPLGRTATYAELAARAGSRAAHRAAGSALASNPLPIVVPCHRVVRSDGALGDYGGGLELKRALLLHEGAVD